MSLTKELKQNKELKELIESSIKIKETTILERKDIKHEIKTDFKNSATVGTAFDYMIRFKLEKNKNVKEISFLAKEVYMHLKNQTSRFDNNFFFAIEQLNSYLNGIETEYYIESIIYFSLFDKLFRNGDMEDLLKVTEIKNIKQIFNPVYQDLVELNKSIKKIKENFNGNYFILNPSFSQSNKIGGADADIIMDDILIDIKTITVAKITKEMIAQLIGYYILAKKDNLKINKIGIYFSRYEKLQIYNISEIITPENLEKIETFFKKEYKII